MSDGQYTEMGGRRTSFPTTEWHLIEEVRGPMKPQHVAVLNILIQGYWKPVYCFLRRHGYGNEEAKDLTRGRPPARGLSPAHRAFPRRSGSGRSARRRATGR